MKYLLILLLIFTVGCNVTQPYEDDRYVMTIEFVERDAPAPAATVTLDGTVQFQTTSTAWSKDVRFELGQEFILLIEDAQNWTVNVYRDDGSLYGTYTEPPVSFRTSLRLVHSGYDR